MSIARHHAEWLSLVEVSGPFLSMPVLLRVFPQGLDAHDPDQARNLRLAYEEWEDNQGGLGPDPAIHRAWIEFVLTQTLGFPNEAITAGQALPPGLEARLLEHGETLRPDLAVVTPQAVPEAGKARLLMQVYPQGQGLERAVEGKLWKASPATRMMELLHAAGVPLGLVTNGEHWMLVWGPRGETTGFASWYSSLWLEEPLTLRAFRSLLSVQRFFGAAESDTVEALFRASSQDQQEVTDQLGYQVRKAVEVLIQAIDRIDKDRDRQLLRGVDEKRLYEAALTIMMRLVFLFSAEERELLLLGDPVYDQNYAVSTLRAQLREAADQHGEEVLERRHDAWSRLLATFRSVYGGISHERLSLPPYGGTLFDPDRFPFLEGREADTLWDTSPAQPLPVNNRTVLHLLEALQVLQVRVPGAGPAEARRLSFRALDIEQIGHVYEGLLDHTAVRAGGPVLGLTGTRDREPEIPLARLEEETGKSEEGLIAFLREETGRSESALRNALTGNAAGNRRGKASQGTQLFSTEPAQQRHPKLLAVCDNDAALYDRVLPFAGLLREDTQGYPVVISAGSVYVTQGTDRRTTGTHYTPRSLTETIVQHTLDPLVYLGPAEGKPQEDWRLRTPREILELKVCDPAMGSGAFLVQVCRYLSQRLAEAWETAEKANPGRVVVSPEGGLSTSAPDERPLPRDPDERLALARRIIADHCLYGVDKNPMAVEMAKLSLWLITLAKGKPFTFLNHRLRHGDSLVGTIWWETNSGRTRALPPSIPDVAYTTRPGDTEIIKDLRARNQGQGVLKLNEETAPPPLDEAASYEKLAEYEDTPEGQQAKADEYERLHENAEARRRRLAADLWTAAWFWPLSGPLARQAPTSPLYWDALQRGREPSPEVVAELTRLLRRIPFFHWSLEFPDVCAHGGFDAVIGNPPFQGGTYISGTQGADYRELLVHALSLGMRGNADLCAYFFLRAVALLRKDRCLGMLATNTIAQGDTRQVGLEQITSRGNCIIRAIASQPWAGQASLEVAVIWVRVGSWNGRFILDGDEVPGISPYLVSHSGATAGPNRLAIKENASFTGCKAYGQGFLLAPEDAKALIQKSPRNAEILFPYLSGEDLTNRVDQSPSRWAINFFDWELDRAESYPDCMQRVRDLVKPERDRLATGNASARDMARRWWQYGRQRGLLYGAINGMDRVLVCPIVTKYLVFAWSPSRVVFTHKVCIVVSNSDSEFALLSSSIHEHWARQYCSTLETRLNYSPTDAFDTFPYPVCVDSLTEVSNRYQMQRTNSSSSREEGLTKTYNRFHNPNEGADDIRRLRELHVEMDYAVAAAYGWTDLDLGHGFHETKQGVRYTLSEPARREVLGRLLKLNHERYAEEVVQGLHSGKKKGRRQADRVGAGGGEELLRSGRRDLFDGQLSLGDTLN